MRTNRDRLQYIDFGDIRDEACLVIPATCDTGGTVMFWLNITSCFEEGILSSRDGSSRSGFAVECDDDDDLL